MPTSDEKTRARLDFLEREARERPRRHRLRLISLALLGYSYPLLLVVFAFALVIALLALAPLAWAESSVELIVFHGFAFLLAVLLVAAMLRAFWIELPDPEGQPLADGEAPALRAMIAEQVRQIPGCKPIDQLYISMHFNASAGQRRRFGLWGPLSQNLVIGLPLMIALTPEQLRAVIAHELGHLRSRHSSFAAWIYRVHKVWDSLSGPLARSTWLKRLVIGWFVQRFGQYFATSTLALRRLHEYEADAQGAALCGPRVAGAALMAIGLADYRLGKRFWPAVFHEASHEPLPPPDILDRMAAFLASAPEPETAGRWRNRERLSRTPITAEHPCLADRLAALGAESLLAANDEAGRATPDLDGSAVPLLGGCRDRLWKLVNTYWKMLIIHRWRYEHATARELARQLETAPAGESGGGSLVSTAAFGSADSDAEPEWARVKVEARYAAADEAIARLHEFLSRWPEHAEANFILANMLLDQDDESAIGLFEAAMARDSDYIAPCLQTLLDYYREQGRDEVVDPIRQRLTEHERTLTRSRRERLHVGRREQLLPHGLPDAELEKLRRVLYRYPQVEAAWLARKQLQLFADKPSFVLGIERRSRGLETDSQMDKYLSASLTNAIPLSCAVVILRWRTRRLRRRIRQACPTPIFRSMD